MEYKFEYTIHPDNSSKEFKKACSKIETLLPNAIKSKLLIDVDGSTIQVYSQDEKKIVVYDDYDVGAVFVKSEIDLSEIFA